MHRVVTAIQVPCLYDVNTLDLIQPFDPHKVAMAVTSWGKLCFKLLAILCNCDCLYILTRMDCDQSKLLWRACNIAYSLAAV
jgi:hypothetical protein